LRFIQDWEIRFGCRQAVADTRNFRVNISLCHCDLFQPGNCQDRLMTFGNSADSRSISHPDEQQVPCEPMQKRKADIAIPPVIT
jgi:hypothetical protein